MPPLPAVTPNQRTSHLPPPYSFLDPGSDTIVGLSELRAVRESIAAMTADSPGRPCLRPPLLQHIKLSHWCVILFLSLPLCGKVTNHGFGPEANGTNLEETIPLITPFMTRGTRTALQMNLDNELLTKQDTIVANSVYSIVPSPHGPMLRTDNLSSYTDQSLTTWLTTNCSKCAVHDASNRFFTVIVRSIRRRNHLTESEEVCALSKFPTSAAPLAPRQLGQAI